jgi:hypothetical protein
MLRSITFAFLIASLSLLPFAGTTSAAEVSKPGEVPRDATGRCHDGSWSSADQKKGACSGHGGVQAWFGKPPKGTTARCQDGTFTKTAGQGACSGHSGVAYWLKDHPAGH